MLSEQINLPDHRLVLGLMHREGDGIRIFTWDGQHWRHLTVEAARAYADYLDANPYAEALKPVSDALRTLADRVSEIGTNAMMRRVSANAMRKFGGPYMGEPLETMPVEGHA
jgi:hypothetical protein